MFPSLEVQGITEKDVIARCKESETVKDFREAVFSGHDRVIAHMYFHVQDLFKFKPSKISAQIGGEFPPLAIGNWLLSKRVNS